MRRGDSAAPRRLGQAVPVIVLALTVLWMLAACSAGEAPGGGDRLSVATGGTGGVYFVYGGALADQITENIEGVEATAESTSASVDNMLLIADESSDIAFTLADTAADAVEGREEFEEPVPAQALAQIYTNYTQIVTTAGSGIGSIEDLRGRSVSVGSPGSGTEVIALRVLRAAGIDPNADIDRQQLGVDESVDAVRDGTIDAFFWSGGLPTGAVTDLATTDQIVLLPSVDYLGALQQQYGEVYQQAIIPAGTYEGFDQDVAVIGVPNYLVVNESMDEQMAYDITRLLFDQQDALAEAHPEANNLDINTAPQTPPLELHPGAQRYYDEAG
ncbi:MAG: TAXI family TRAP transporter solute-binding subunit [Actinomycetota bacterium]|nr:TAXI family TRAP transporter solute-binding subunit [Actinomycetota bacterium]